MPQNKIVRISLLVAVFAISAVLGYFIADMVIKEEVAPVEPIVEDYEYEYVEEQVDTLEFVDTLVVEEEEVIEEEKPVVYRMFTEAQMEEFLNHGDFMKYLPSDSKVIFPQDMVVVVHNIREGERGSNLSQICSNIGMGQWTGVTVNDIDYAENNQILKVELTAHYPEEEYEE